MGVLLAYDTHGAHGLGPYDTHMQGQAGSAICLACPLLRTPPGRPRHPLLRPGLLGEIVSSRNFEKMKKPPSLKLTRVTLQPLPSGGEREIWEYFDEANERIELSWTRLTPEFPAGYVREHS